MLVGSECQPERAGLCSAVSMGRHGGPFSSSVQSHQNSTVGREVDRACRGWNKRVRITAMGDCPAGRFYFVVGQGDGSARITGC